MSLTPRKNRACHNNNADNLVLFYSHIGEYSLMALLKGKRKKTRIKIQGDHVFWA